MTPTSIEGEPVSGAGSPSRRLAYLGNFGPTFSTESHVALSIESLGHHVVRLQEGDVPPAEVADAAAGCDMLLWTQTGDLAARFPISARQAMLDRLADAGIPTVGFHLDRWWGLSREGQIREEPFFRCSLVVTADGGHDRQWEDAGVRHVWMPPAVYHAETGEGTPRDEYRSDVVFVGSWQHYGHAEWWPHRKAMLDAVRRRYRRRFVCWPQQGAVRGQALNDLYASVKVVVGDSCLAGGITRYVSDRIPETIGRGGFLIHPRVEGITDGSCWTEGEHLACYDLGDHDELLRLVDHYLTHDEERERIRSAGQAHVRAHHTYAHRMAAILETVFADQQVSA